MRDFCLAKQQEYLGSGVVKNFQTQSIKGFQGRLDDIRNLKNDSPENFQNF